jgi:tRNA G18 (ribose-2'-O)-methylase SpoU
LVSDNARAARVAWLLGAEGAGLSDVAMACADVRVRIPMVGGVDSLNVGTAGAIAFHHTFTRSRRSDDH